MFVRSAIGALALLIAFGPLVVGSRALRRRLLPEWSGPPGWLAQFVVVLTACLLVILTLGVLAWYSLVPTTILLAACGIGMWAAASRLESRPGEPLVVPPERLGRPAKVVAVVAVSFVAATWGARTYLSLSHGLVTVDSLWYHLPLSARYAHLHSITGIYNDVPNLSGFYPVNSEFIHSLGMVLLGSDLFPMILAFAWAVVALLAAWCIGRPYGMSAVCITGLSVLLCAPGFLGTQAGTADVDIVGVALLLTTAALLTTANAKRLTTDWVVLALAAMPVGFAVGSKWTFVPVSGALAIGVIVLLPRGRRLRGSMLWLGIVGLLGSFSYVRNLVKAGSPLPPIELRFGPIGWKRTVPETEGMSSVSRFLFDTDAWRVWLIPGLSRWFGYTWWAVLGLVVLGLVLAVVTGPGSLLRMFGCVALVAMIGFIMQPQLLTLSGVPYFFAANVRYATVGMAFGLVLLPLSPVFTRRAFAWLVPIAFVAVIAVMQLDPTLWPTELRDLRWENPVRGADAVAGAVAGVVTLGIGLVAVVFGSRIRARLSGTTSAAAYPSTGSPERARRTRLVPALLAISLTALGLVAFDQWYLAHRYARPEAATPFLPTHFLSWDWARDIHDARIGVQPGGLDYPLYGNALSNTIEAFPNFVLPQGGVLPSNTPEGCEDFRRMINSRRYDYVVLFGSPAPVELAPGSPSFEQTTPQVLWLDSDRSATNVLRGPLESVYRIDGRLDPDGCAGTP